MDGLSDHLLARSGLPDDQDGRLRFGDLADQVEDSTMRALLLSTL